jgi:hypothetical protein
MDSDEGPEAVHDAVARDDNEVEVIAETRRFVLIRGAEEYALWPASHAEQPLATFPLTVDGIDDAMAELATRSRALRRQTLLPSALRWGVVVSSIVWAGSSVAYSLGIFLRSGVIGNEGTFFIWTFSLSRAAMALTGALLAISIAGWLKRNPGEPRRY